MGLRCKTSLTIPLYEQILQIIVGQLIPRLSLASANSATINSKQPNIFYDSSRCENRQKLAALLKYISKLGNDLH